MSYRIGPVTDPSVRQLHSNNGGGGHVTVCNVVNSSQQEAYFGKSIRELTAAEKDELMDFPTERCHEDFSEKKWVAGLFVNRMRLNGTEKSCETEKVSPWTAFCALFFSFQFFSIRCMNYGVEIVPQRRF